MGAWGVALFADDDALDIRSDYRDQLLAGASDEEALQRVLDRHRDLLADPDRGATLRIALAMTMWEVGRLTDSVRDKALGLLDDGGGAELWHEDPSDLRRRRTVLTRVRAKLASPQPNRKSLRPPRKVRTDIAPGEVLALEHRGLQTLVCVGGEREMPKGIYPVAVVLDFIGETVPPPSEVARLEPRERAKPREPWNQVGGVVVFRRSTADWAQHGFVLVGRRTPPPIDRHRGVFLTGGWPALADSIRWSVDRVLSSIITES